MGPPPGRATHVTLAAAGDALGDAGAGARVGLDARLDDAAVDGLGELCRAAGAGEAHAAARMIAHATTARLMDGLT